MDKENNKFLFSFFYTGSTGFARSFSQLPDETEKDQSATGWKWYGDFAQIPALWNSAPRTPIRGFHWGLSLVNLRLPTTPSKKPFPRRGIVYFAFLPERQKYPDDPVNPVKIILGNLFLPKPWDNSYIIHTECYSVSQGFWNNRFLTFHISLFTFNFSLLTFHF